MEPLLSGRPKRKSSLGLKKVLDSLRGVRADSDEEEELSSKDKASCEKVRRQATSSEQDARHKVEQSKRKKRIKDRIKDTNNTSNVLVIEPIVHKDPGDDDKFEKEIESVKERTEEGMDMVENQIKPENFVNKEVKDMETDEGRNSSEGELGNILVSSELISGENKISDSSPERCKDIQETPVDGQVAEEKYKRSIESDIEGEDEEHDGMMGDGFTDEEEDYSTDEKQATSDAEDEAIQLQLIQQLRDQQAEEEKLVPIAIVEPQIEKKKYTVPKDTLNFLKHVKKSKKKEKGPMSIRLDESTSDASKEVFLDKLMDDVDRKKSIMVTPLLRGSYPNPKNMTTLAKLAMSKKRKKGEPSERSVLFKYSQHEENGWYICPKENCKFKSRHSKNVYTHEKRHNGTYPYMCSLCGKRFILKKNYRNHLDAHQDIRPYQCQECGKWFRNQTNLQRHNLVHTGEKPYQCEVESCEVAFKDKINLKKHTALVHEGLRPYECTYQGCVYVAYDRHSLDKHKVKHKDLQDRPSEKCEICDKVLYGARSMQSHMLLHKGENYECPFCDYTTVFKQALQAHSMRKHYMDLEGNHVERKFKCKQCDFATFWEHDLRFHVTKHGAYKPFKCPICDYSTVLKGSLQKHMRLHTGEQPYACNLCGKAYTNQSGLARHKRSHTGEKPHKCDICGKKYADMKTLRNHRYSHLNLKPFMCPLCSYNCTKKDVLLTHYKRVHGEGHIPDNIRPKPFQRVIMRVTSGQTADEIISNIAPPGKGERQLLVMGGGEGGEGGEQDEKFLVIHEDEAQALSLIQDNQSLQHESLSSESVFRIIQSADGQPTVDSLSKNLDFLADDTRKVMKIATAPKNTQREKYFQRLHVNQVQAPPTHPASHVQANSSTQHQQLQLARLPNLEGLGSNFVLLPSRESGVLQNLQLDSKNELVAIPASQSAIGDIVNEALNVQNFGLAPSSVEMGGSLESVLQQQPKSGSGEHIHLTHPILQSQLKRDPDHIPLIHTVSDSQSTFTQGQPNAQTVFIQVQDNPMESIEQELTPTILASDLQTELLIKTEGSSSLDSESQKMQNNLVGTGSNQLEYPRTGSENLVSTEGQMDISSNLLGDENNEKYVLHLPEGHDLNPKDGATEIADIESGEYVIAYLQNEGNLTDNKDSLTIGDSIQNIQYATLNNDNQTHLLTSEGQGYFEGQGDSSVSFRTTDNPNELGNSNIMVTAFNGETGTQINQENAVIFKMEDGQFDINGQVTVSFDNSELSGDIQQQHHHQVVAVGDNNAISSLSSDGVRIVTAENNVLQIGSSEGQVGGSVADNSLVGDKIDIEQLERQINDMSEEMLIESAQQATDGTVFRIDHTQGHT